MDKEISEKLVELIDIYYEDSKENLIEALGIAIGCAFDTDDIDIITERAQDMARKVEEEEEDEEE